MSIRYHDCGWPVQVEEIEHGSHIIRFFDWNDVDGPHRVTMCARCGEHLSADRLSMRAPEAAASLRAWSLTWPFLRKQLEQRIAEQAICDDEFYAYHAQRAIVAFDESLHAITRLVTDMSDQDRTRDLPVPAS